LPVWEELAEVHVEVRYSAWTIFVFVRLEDQLMNRAKWEFYRMRAVLERPAISAITT
jgi:hypothetical protein